MFFLIIFSILHLKLRVINKNEKINKLIQNSLEEFCLKHAIKISSLQ